MSSSGTIDHKCPNCAATLNFNPSEQNWKCEFCKCVFSKDDLSKYTKEELTKDSKKNILDMDVYTCTNCGAQIIADENTSATFCIYCKNTAILRNKLIGEFNPNKIIPFKKTKEEAINKFVEFRKGKPLAPKEFTNKKNIQEIKGVYIPFWLYDYDVHGKLNANGINETVWISSNYQYTKTDIYNIDREASMSFYKIPVDGSLRLDNHIMNSIEPYDYNDLEDFNYSYLSGFYAEKYDVDSNTAQYDALKRAYGSATDKLSGISSFSNYSINSTDHKAQLKNVDYALLPVWLLNIKYKDKIYTFAMNGQTGKMIGNIPTDRKKIVLYSISIFIILVSILSLLWWWIV